MNRHQIRSNRKAIGKIPLIVVLVIAVVAVAAIVFVALPALGITAPKPEVTMTQGHQDLSGLNYVYYVDATVKNNGASGNVTVYASISGADRTEQQSKSVYIAAGESQTVTFSFDISVLGMLSDPSITYKAWV